MKFSIRDLFLVTLIVALAAGWWVDRSRLGKAVDGWKERVEDVNNLLNQETGATVTWNERLPGE